MAGWATLKAAVANVIKTNSNQEITGAVLQNTLNSIISAVGENATFVDIATPNTNPGTPDGPVFYIAATAGEYSNFGGISVKNVVTILTNKAGSWKSIPTNIQIGSTLFSNSIKLSGQTSGSFSEVMRIPVFIKNYTRLRCVFEFSSLAGVGWRIYSSLRPQKVIFSGTSSDVSGEKFATLDADINELILYVEGGSAGACTVYIMDVTLDKDVAAVKEDVAAVKEDVAAVKEDVAAVKEDNISFSNALDLSGQTSGSFSEVTRKNVLLKSGSKLKVSYNFSSLAGVGWRIYSSLRPQKVIFSGTSSDVSGEKFATLDADINELILYVEGGSAGACSVILEQLSDKEELQPQISNNSESIKELNNIVGIENSTSIAEDNLSFSTANLKRIYTYTSSFNNSKITVDVSNIINGAGITRCVVYRGSAGHNQVEIPQSENGFHGNVSLDGYNSGTPVIVYLIGVTDLSGTCSLTITESLEAASDSLSKRVQALEQNTPTAGFQSPFAGLVGIVTGDSHAVGRSKWAPYLFEKIGATYDAETTAAVVGQANSCGEGYEAYADSFYCQAIRAVEQFKAGKQIDLIIAENVHYSVGNTNINEAFPLKIQNIIDLGKKEIKVSNATAWFNSNINSILGSIQRKLGSVVYMQCTDTKYLLTFSGTPSAGELVLTLDGQQFNATLTGSESLNEAVEKLGIWVFGDYTDWENSVSGNIITLTYKGSALETPSPLAIFDAGTTGLSMSQTPQSTYSDYRRYFESYDTETDWLDASKWILISNWFGFSGLKGFYETLLENIPNVIIICVAFPCYGITTAQFDTELGANMKEFYDSSFYKSNRQRATTFMLAGEYYNAKVIDVEKLCNITPNNWFNFNPSGNVHPNQLGYTRWADTIIKEIL